ncbi:MAG TPA: hypothetical protein VMX35_08650 [Acidobacteriota bacterium]|nr:hypothetical protein [Acidobacteriota bacterium]
MPQMHDIFRDGVEFIRRSLRRIILSARLSDERQKLSDCLSELGRKAWEQGIPTCKSLPTGKELGKIQDKIDDLDRRAASESESLETQIRETESAALEEGERFHDAISRLEGALGQKAQREKILFEIKGRIQELSDTRERLKDDLKFCSDKRRQLEIGGPDASGAGKSAAELTATEDALKNQSKEIAGAIKTLQNRLRYNERALPPLEQTTEGIREDIKANRAQCGLLKNRLKEIRGELREHRNNAASEREPLHRQRRSLYPALGKELLKNRSDEPELKPLFSSADLSMSTIEGLKQDIKAGNQLLELLDQNAVAAFIGILFLTGTLALMIFSLIIALIIIL